MEKDDIYNFENTSVDEDMLLDASLLNDSDMKSGEEISGNENIWNAGSVKNPNITNNVSSNKTLSPQVSGTTTKRPMTSVVGKGYDPTKKVTKGGMKVPDDHLTLKKRSDNSPQYKGVEMEQEVHRLYEESSVEHVNRNHVVALDRAKQALRKEIQLGRFQEDNGIRESNVDLTFAVKFNLSQMYYHNSMFHEAMEAFTTIVKDDVYDGLGGGRLRANMGNIHFEKGEFAEAIKNYNMALDVLPPETHNRLKSHILRNIGIAYFKSQKYDIAANHFEQAHDLEKSSVQVIHNLIICYYALGDRKGMKKSFVELLHVNVYGLSPPPDDSNTNKNKINPKLKDPSQDISNPYNQSSLTPQDSTNTQLLKKSSSSKNAISGEEEETYLLDDELSNYLKEIQEEYFTKILQCARLIADYIEKDWERGYDFIIEKLKSFQVRYERKLFSSYSSLSDEMEMEKALKYLRTKKFTKAIKALKDFELRDDQLLAKAATNLSFIYLLEKNISAATKYSNIAIEHDKFNAKALVNKGICHFLKKEYKKAKDEFARALNKEQDCFEAIYNIGLIDKHLGRFKESLRTFERLFVVLTDSLEVRWQICDLYRILEMNDKAIDNFTRLLAQVKHDPKALYQLGCLHHKENDEANMNNYFIESYKYYPVNLEVVKKLAFNYVSNDVYEMALRYFERAAQIDPNEIKWKLHVAHCLRHTNQYNKAILCYRKIHNQFPENMECLTRIIKLLGDLGLDKEKSYYMEKRESLEKIKIKKEKLQKKYQNEEIENLSPIEENPTKKKSNVKTKRNINFDELTPISSNGEVEEREHLVEEDKDSILVRNRMKEKKEQSQSFVDTNKQVVHESNDADFMDLDGLGVLEDLYN